MHARRTCADFKIIDLTYIFLSLFIFFSFHVQSLLLYRKPNNPRDTVDIKIIDFGLSKVSIIHDDSYYYYVEFSI
ncbi:MAG: hypothetical protein ACI90V_008317 [Bacillariaceae sp.]|jgi:hypothetical protein